MEAYLGEIRMFAGNYAPVGWALCDGSTLPISEYEPLYSLLGTTYGGDGQTTFAVPDLRGRIPIGQGAGPGLTSRPLASLGGTETVSLTASNLPMHNHVVLANKEPGTVATVQSEIWAANSINQFFQGAATAQMAASTITAAGGNQPHANMMPFQVISFIICTNGLYPQQN